MLINLLFSFLKSVFVSCSATGSLSITTADNFLNPEVIIKPFEISCVENGGSGAIEIVRRGPEEIRDCVLPIVDVTLLRQELEAARRQGELNTVSKRYCEAVPLIKQCMRDLYITFTPCLNSEQKATMKGFLNKTTTMLDFFCRNGGDHIASKYA